MARQSTKGLLKKIQLADLEAVCISITEKAAEWATAGFMHEANQLLEILWSHGMEHSGHLRGPDQGFLVMWEVSGIRPANIPFDYTNIEEIERDNWGHLIHPVAGEYLRYSFSDVPVNDWPPQYLLAKVISAAYNGSEDVPTLLAALDTYLQSDDAVGSSFFCAATVAVLLAARNGLNGEAEKFLTLWGEGYLKYPENYSLCYLMRDRSSSRFLLKGILSPVFNLTGEAIRGDIEAIRAMLTERMSKGRTLPYSHLSWTELLNKISRLAIETNAGEYSAEAVASGWLVREGASEEEIQRAEDRLGIHFPEDYRQFLSVSNGFDAITTVDAALIPVDQVGLFISLDKEMVEGWIREVRTDDISFGERFRKSIVIGGGYGDEQNLLLVPGGEGGQWECWFFAVWALGETTYPGFRFYMEQQLQLLEDTF